MQMQVLLLIRSYPSIPNLLSRNRKKLPKLNQHFTMAANTESKKQPAQKGKNAGGAGTADKQDLKILMLHGMAQCQSE